MRKMILLILLAVTFNNSFSQNNDSRMDWWNEGKFGLFLHWGLYSVTAGDWNGHRAKGNEHFMLYERIPVTEYGKIAQHFNPDKFNADEWVKYAKNAGMKYIVITTKHHDGFAMYNSPSSDYNIVKQTPWHQDPIKQLAAACKKEGIKLCFYYSLGRDWQDPDVPTNWPTKGGRSNTWDYPNEDAKDFSKYFRRKVLPQVKELLTQYGPIGIMWFDTPELITKEQSAELKALIRKLQPNCIINSRVGNSMGDYEVSEQKLSADGTAKPWEACITMNATWGYNHYDQAWKSPELLVRQLIEVVGKGGDLLLNVSPMGDGAIPEKSIENLKAIGDWMRMNGEAIYGTHPWKVVNEGAAIANTYQPATDGKATMLDNANDATSKLIKPDIYFTAKGNSIYVFARSWKDKEVLVKSLPLNELKVSKILLLGSNQKINWRQTNTQLTITIPPNLANNIPVFVFKVM